MFVSRNYLESLENDNAYLRDRVEALETDNDIAKETLETKLRTANTEIAELKREAAYSLKERDLYIEKAQIAVIKTMQAKLAESDVLREKFSAKLEVYEKLDNKDQINKISSMLMETIKGLSNRQVIVATQQSKE